MYSAPSRAPYLSKYIQAREGQATGVQARHGAAPGDLGTGTRREIGDPLQKKVMRKRWKQARRVAAPRTTLEACTRTGLVDDVVEAVYAIMSENNPGKYPPIY